MTRTGSDDPTGAFRRRAARAGLELGSTLQYGPFALNLDRYELTVRGARVEMSPVQLELLAVFLAAPDRVWSRRELNELTGSKRTESRRVDVRLARLRRSLGEDAFRSILGRGWILRTIDDTEADGGSPGAR